MHLDDLMLRRTRLGLILPQGGLSCLPRLQAEVGPSLDWSEQRWAAEVQRYRQAWQRAYAPQRINCAP
ncbi:unnamed protein product, partial [Laminaria digitata]